MPFDGSADTDSRPRSLRHRAVQLAQKLKGQVLGPVHLAVLRHDLLVPNFTRGQQRLVFDRLEEVGAGQVQEHLPVAEDRGQVERLGVDGEAMLAQANDHFAFDEQLLPVLELADGVFADGFQAALDVIGLDRVAQFLELGDQAADLFDHQVRREVAVDIVDRRQRFDAGLDSLQDPFGGVLQRGGALISGFDQLDLAAVEGVVDFLAFLGQLDDEFVELGKAAFEFFDLDHQLGQELVALLRRIGDVQKVDDALVQQPQLRIEFGHAFDRQQLFGLAFQRRPGRVHLGKDGRNVVDDRDSMRGVVDLQVADDVDQHLQFTGAGRHIGFQLPGVRDAFQGIDLGGVIPDSLLVGLQSGGLQQELDAAVGQAIGLFDDLFLQRVHQGRIAVPQVPQRDRLAPRTPQIGQRADEVVDVIESFAADRGQDVVDLLPNAVGLGGRVPLDPHDFLEFVDGRRRRRCGSRPGFRPS